MGPTSRCNRAATTCMSPHQHIYVASSRHGASRSYPSARGCRRPSGTLSVIRTSPRSANGADQIYQTPLVPFPRHRNRFARQCCTLSPRPSLPHGPWHPGATDVFLTHASRPRSHRSIIRQLSSCCGLAEYVPAAHGDVPTRSSVQLTEPSDAGVDRLTSLWPVASYPTNYDLWLALACAANEGIRLLCPT